MSLLKLDDLPLEILDIIARYDPQIFATLRSVNRDYRNFTNEYMEVYKTIFSRKIIKVLNNGKTEKYFVLPDRTLHGFYQRWFNNTIPSQREIECFYKNGRLEGLYRRWFNNENLEIECIYKNGLENGLYREWWENGQKYKEFNYKNGLEDGLCEIWLPDGEKYLKCIFVNGTIIKNIIFL